MQGPTAMQLNVCYQSTSPVGLNKRLEVDCDILATYLVIYMTDLVATASLVLCEVEIMSNLGKQKTYNGN